MDEITIHLFLDSEGNYQFNTYEGSPQEVAAEVEGEMDEHLARDGGCCTTTMANAIDMAADQAKKLV
jgi:hypothetical protein